MADPITFLFTKIPGVLARADNTDETNAAELKKVGDAKTVRLDRYYAAWRNRIHQAARENKLISNGWAFSTLSGLAAFEAHVRTDPDVRSIYFNRSGEIGTILEAISEQMGSRSNLGGVIVYGYGNLVRESYFLEYAKNSKMLTSQRIYLLDCSLFYHIFAKSSLNPLKRTFKEAKLKAVLLDYLEEPGSRESLKWLRNDLNPARPVLHLFLGNTFGNNDEPTLKGMLEMSVMPGDFVVGEYALYDSKYFEETGDDYVSVMACRAAAELFAVPQSAINSRNVTLSDSSKATELEFVESDSGKKLVFRSMLRRVFSSGELTSGQYQLIAEERPLGGRLKLDALRCLNGPNA